MLSWVKDDRHVFAWVPTLIWCVIILFFSILPYRLHPPLTLGHFDKMVHFFEYTVLAVLIGRGLYSTGRSLSTGHILLILMLGSGYGILMELVQRFVPGRSAALGDVMANVAGMVFGIILARLVLWQK